LGGQYHYRRNFQEGWALASFFGRATYDYASKYYLTVSVREDGSSKLAITGDNALIFCRLAYFVREIMHGIDFIDDLKLRGGWGMNGNQEGIPKYTRYGLVRIPVCTINR
jgi:hypothetical protein